MDDYEFDDHVGKLVSELRCALRQALIARELGWRGDWYEVGKATLQPHLTVQDVESWAGRMEDEQNEHSLMFGVEKIWRTSRTEAGVLDVRLRREHSISPPQLSDMEVEVDP